MSERKILHQSPAGARFFADVGPGEFYVRRTGVTISDPRIHKSIVGKEPPLSAEGEHRPWLGHDSQRVLQALAQCSAVLVEGDLGAGKSTVLYGARTLLRMMGQPYVHIDGHFLNRAQNHGPAIRSAEPNGRVLLVDSFDYGFVKPSVRGGAPLARSVWLPAIEEHFSAGGKVVVTSHTLPWLRAKTHPGALEEMMNAIPDDTEVLRVGGVMDAEALRGVAEVVYDRQFAACYLQFAADAPRTAYTYRVMKQVGARLGSSLTGVTQDSFNTMVRQIDAETRKKMRTDEDYDLC